MVKISTAQFRYSGPDRLDITFKTGDPVFAPTKRLVYDYKYRGLSEDHYKTQYIQLMNNSYRNQQHRWNQILAMDTVVFVCFCPPNSFCHRLLLAQLFIQLGAEYCGEIYLF